MYIYIYESVSTHDGLCTTGSQPASSLRVSRSSCRRRRFFALSRHWGSSRRRHRTDRATRDRYVNGEARVDAHARRETRLRAERRSTAGSRGKRIGCDRARVRLSTAVNQLRIPTGAVLRAERARASERNVGEEQRRAGGGGGGESARRSETAGMRIAAEQRERKRKEEGKRERETAIGARSSGEREQTTWSNCVYKPYRPGVTWPCFDRNLARRTSG